MNPSPKIIAWDFDGVLNRGIVDGRFIWFDSFDTDIGQSSEVFQKHVFAENIKAILTGEEDLKDRVSDWAAAVGYTGGADTVLAYWLAKDAHPDPEMLELMQQLSQRGVRHVIATNNEARRAHYIEHDMGFGQRVEHIFTSGRMGLAKPDPAYFEYVTNTLNVEPADILLVDDSATNIVTAQELGWQAFHFTDQTRNDLKAHLEL